MKVTVLVGGVGGARFLQGLKTLLGDDDEITAIV
ncbi:MAG: 2-phospho-L-lactate transferase, partial [Rhodococcus sp. (in: high G+C Gram-positive bacteria)]